MRGVGSFSLGTRVSANRFFKAFLTAFTLIFILSNCSPSDQNKKYSKDEIGDYLMSHPQIVIEAIENAARYKKDKEAELFSDNLNQMRHLLVEDSPASIAHGDGDLTLIEFFDYQCGYCKKAFLPLMEAVERDGAVRLIYKEFPILGDDSLFAARAAVAAQKQGQYKKFHRALMTTPGRLNPQKILAIAKALGLNIARLKRDMADAKTQKALEHNIQLAQKLSIQGTPSFILISQNHSTLFTGAQSSEQLSAMFQNARGTNAD